MPVARAPRAPEVLRMLRTWSRAVGRFVAQGLTPLSPYYGYVEPHRRAARQAARLRGPGPLHHERLGAQPLSSTERALWRQILGDEALNEAELLLQSRPPHE